MAPIGHRQRRASRPGWLRPTAQTAAIRDSRYSFPRSFGHGRDQLGDPPLSSLWGLRSLDGGHVFAFEAKGQALEGRSGLAVAAQGLGEVRRLSDDPRRGIKLEIDYDDVAFGDPARGTVRGADPDQALPAHHGDPAAPRMAVDRDGDQIGRAHV